MKRILAFALAAAMIAGAVAQTKAVTSRTVLSAASTVAAGAAVPGVGDAKTYQVYATTTAGTGTFVVNVECSNGTGWDVLGTITLPSVSTTASSNSFSSADRCLFLRGNVTTVTGTGTVGTLTMGY